MLLINSIATLAFFAPVQAGLFPSFLAPRATTSCPAVWTTISRELTNMFVTNLQCNDAARATIRAVFHDCFPQGGCDGSLALFQDELSRPENSPLVATMNSLKALAVQYKVGVADMLMFAGSHAVVSCPGGPTTKTYVGRKDATAAAPPNQLPQPNATAADAKSHFAAQGFTSQDLAALIGAHTAARQFTVDTTKSGASEDSTPGIWDILYFMQTILKTAPFTFVVDMNLLADSQTGPFMETYSVSKGAWDAAFAPAMAKMEVLGAPFTQIDCTGALPKSVLKRSATQNYARSIINSLTMGKIAAF